MYLAFIMHKFVFDVVFEFLSKHYHQNYIVLFRQIEIFLKFDDIIKNEYFLNYILNYLFRRLFFIENKKKYFF